MFIHGKLLNNGNRSPGWRRVGGALLVVALVAAAMLSASRPVLAGGCTGSGRASGTGPKPSNYSYFDGLIAQDNGSELGGVYSDMDNYTPFVATGDTGAFSSEHVILKQQAPCQWAQDGYKTFFNSSMVLVHEGFVGYTTVGNTTGCSPYTDNADITQIDYPSFGGETGPHYFTVLYGACSPLCVSGGVSYQNKFTFQHDGVQIGSAYLVNDTTNGRWFVPDLAEIMGQISKFKEQMPGDASDKEDFSSNHFWSGGSGGSWKEFGKDYWNPAYQTTYFDNNHISTTEDQIWDKTATGCAS